MRKADKKGDELHKTVGIEGGGGGGPSIIPRRKRKNPEGKKEDFHTSEGRKKKSPHAASSKKLEKGKGVVLGREKKAPVVSSIPERGRGLSWGGEKNNSPFGCSKEGEKNSRLCLFEVEIEGRLKRGSAWKDRGLERLPWPSQRGGELQEKKGKAAYRRGEKNHSPKSRKRRKEGLLYVLKRKGSRR